MLIFGMTDLNESTWITVITGSLYVEEVLKRPAARRPSRLPNRQLCCGESSHSNSHQAFFPSRLR